jgi:tricarballylate dehydrogenase
LPSPRIHDEYDVIVVGGGNAALCAAMAARHIVPRVLVLERAPVHMRGGNTRHTRNVRCAHPTSDKYCSGAYPEQEFFDDLVAVTGGPANPDLARYVIHQSSKLYGWMSEHGASWQPPLAGTLHLGRTNRWFLGGGKALLNGYYRTAERMGISVRYDAVVEDLVIENGRFEAVALRGGELVRGRTVVVATGGYEANLEWLERNWGEAARNFVVRGTPYNDGMMLAALLAKGAKAIGDPKGFHAIALDARAPKYDGGIVTRLDAIPFGIVVNRLAQRFYDEGEEVWPKRYAIWGGLVAAQPEQLAYCIVDAQTIRKFLAPAFKPYEAETIEGLARACSLEPKALTETVTEYNRATAGNGPLRIDALDGNSTRDILPKKSNWALPIDDPPYYAFPLRPGVTFTYMGVEVDETAHILEQSGRPMENVFAAGEIMSGNILTKGYLAGFGLTIGSVLGELAGRSAATRARA